MKTKKHTIKLQKSSGLFMQLGLVLTLAIVYLLLEHQTEVNKPIALADNSNHEITKIVELKDFIIEREKIVQKVEQQPKKEQEDITEFIKSDDPELVEPDLPFETSDPEERDPIHNSTLVVVENEDPLEDDTHLITNVHEVPIYPGCEKGTRAEKKACFESKVRKLINRKFNSELGTILGLEGGKQRISVQFKITKNGDIEILGARANHKKLEKEGKRVVNLLPKMKPGKHNGKPVDVSYMVPIVFNIQ
ncbi:MAG: energy transducer TonB [Urechidicola sp.]|nr:energy transducer TonB [Urechidicola sp.]